MNYIKPNQPNQQNQQNPFTNLTQGHGQQNPFIFNFQEPISFGLGVNNTTQLNPNAYQYQQMYIDNLPLIDKIKNLKMNGVDIFGLNDIIGIFGEDVSGIDVCCVRGQQIVAIKHDTILTGSSLKNLTHFLYSCAIVEEKHGPITKLFVGCLQFDNPTTVALNRNKISHHINGNQSVMTTETTNYIRTLFL